MSKKCPTCGAVSQVDALDNCCPACSGSYRAAASSTAGLASEATTTAAAPTQARSTGKFTEPLRTKGPEEKFCVECGSIIRSKAEICPSCGVRQPALEGFASGIPNQRKCLSCGHTGVMKTWLRNYNMPQLVAFVGLLFWILPGLAFMAWAWGKYKCPKCDKVGENVAA